ncbi:fused MFS/spermidine synthase [bacterium]|nr:fused MFS/spermidine synthase [bacterium]
MGFEQFHARQAANFALAFSYMIIPAFFMGLAFPLAGAVNAHHKKQVGHAVGNVLAYNTVGAILGSAVSGYVLIYIFGIERSLQLLTIINIGFGLLVMFSIRNVRMVRWGIACLTIGALFLLALQPNILRMWDMQYFAIFQNNQPEAYNTPQRKQEAIQNTDVLFFKEGIDSTISVITVKGGNQGLLVNGKVVASASLKDQQCQYTLGHLPMLLHNNPRKVLVIGLGTGMTLGATSVHPSVEELTLAEIEPNVVGAARTFGKYNNNVLDDPKLKIIHNDGRNFLMTTRNRYDVITADPIHPWTQGSGYLYTDEYFKIASEHLLPGGIMCQWLPIYELSAGDLKSVLKTFSKNFKYSMVWLAQYDAEIIGSDSPIIIDEAELAKRIAFPAIAQNLKSVMMDSSTDFLSYFIMGTEGVEAFGGDGIVNTDDNLYLEFSTPLSLGENVMGINVDALARNREGILPYLVHPKDPSARQEQEKKWTVYREAASLADYIHALILNGSQHTQEFRSRLVELERRYPAFSPVRFIRAEYEDELLQIPKLLDMMPLVFLDEGGQRVVIEISAVIVRVSHERAKVAFVDNAARKIFGQLYFSGNELDERMGGFTQDVFADIQATYRSWAENARRDGKEYPFLTSTMSAVEDIIQEKCNTPENP